MTDASNASNSFIPTGLLGGVKDQNESAERPELDLSFRPTGLLSMPTPADASKVQEQEETVTGNYMDNESIPSMGHLERELGLVPTDESPYKLTGLLLSDSIPTTTESAFQSTGLLGGISHSFDASAMSDPFGEPSLLGKPTPMQSHIRAKTFTGRTVFIRKRASTKKDTPSTSSQMNMHKILDVPIHRMLEQLSREKAKELQAREQESLRKTKPKIVQDTLWVDRYRPVRFTELVGNERVARDIMGWIKQWEYCVFGKRSLKGKKRVREDEEVNMEDEFRRPKEKILLLSGPPGLGKTTMAHVLARQSGYEVMEVNASDARTAQDVDIRIRPALESGSSVGGSKPVLLVIDEIDGATGGADNSSGFINKLISLTYDRPKKAQGSQAKKKPGGKRPLLRPIICICNDINAAVLSKLRSYTFQVRLQRPSDIHVIKRLKEVCEIEKLTADGRALSALVGVAKGDLRGCINTLQFIKSRNEDVTESVIRQATQGMKEGEADTSILSVVTDIFAPMSKKRVKELGLTDNEESRYVGRLSRTIDSCGRDNSVAIGCFAHYPKLRKHDADFSRYLKADDWLVTFDLFSSAMYNAGEFALNQYLPYMLVPFYPLFQERGGPKIERDQADWETMQTTKANDEIYKSLGRGLQAASTRLGGAFRHFVYQPIIQLEFAPYINRIINPPLRPVNWQIIKAEERMVLQRLVAIMAALELRFVQERGEDGQLTYRLDPPVDVFITYDNKRAADIGASRYAVRHIVAEEVDTALAARSTDVVEKGKRGKHENLFGGSKTVVPPPTTSGNGKPGDGPPRKRIKVPEPEDKPVLDFFGRPVKPKTSTGANSRGAKSSSITKEKKFRVVYKFVEGNSAAVRKPVKIDTFM